MKQWRRWVLVTLVAIGGVGLTGEASANERWGPFRGQVVDVETDQPIPGAVALAVWWKLVPNLVAGNREFYDAREAATGPEGTFEIPRLSVQLWPLGVQPAQITVFAPGYKWVGTVVTPSDAPKFVAPTIVQMERLKTPAERRKFVLRLPPAGVPHQQMNQYIKALNLELSALGMGTYPTEEKK